MRLLLDTHVFLWWRADAPQLSRAAREALSDPRHDVFVSAVVGWEIVIKRGLGKLVFDGSIAAAISEEGFDALPIAVTHVDRVAELPPHHRDPFDRLLVAAAQVEGLTLVTHDPLILRYAETAFLAV